ncbi:hypothetical protein Cpir12675_000227 [Ceratocystis pirilliformis]|uniref:N-alpha-acetyltransferase 40 n=1 Tax=Ceratocystis pirilliformis TaxID=259994 RepID=A0ABR3ZLZ5_9PEZI
MGLERVLSKMRKHKREPAALIGAVNEKRNTKFFDDHIKQSPHWVDRWVHPKTHESYAMRFASASELSDEDLLECRNLVEATSRQDYADSEMGWDADAKLAEMKLPELRYVMLLGPNAVLPHPTTLTPPPSSSRSIRSLRSRSASRSASPLPMAMSMAPSAPSHAINSTLSEFRTLHASSPSPGPDCKSATSQQPQIRPGLHGFISFMPTIEDGYAVVYCYEIHLVQALRGSGLGAQLISLLKDVARGITGVEKVMLTCFTSNHKAREFYSGVGFMVDDFSPQPRKMRSGKVLWPEYLILSWEVS